MEPKQEALTLCVWWAVWSLADTYLLPHTPFSELAVLSVCVLWYAWRVSARRNTSLPAPDATHASAVCDSV